MPNSFYEINVLDYFPQNNPTLYQQLITGQVDCYSYVNVALQEVMHPQSSPYFPRRLYFPLAQGQIYLIDTTLTIDVSDIYIYGDAPIAKLSDNNYLADPRCGYITTSRTNNDAIFKFTCDDISQNNPGAIYVEGLTFLKTVSKDTPLLFNTAIQFDIHDNAPQRGVNIKKCSCFGFDNFVLCQINWNDIDPNHFKYLKYVIIGYLTIEESYINGTNYTLNSSDPIMGFRMKNVQSESGARIMGLLCAESIITDNNFENQTNPYDTGSTFIPFNPASPFPYQYYYPLDMPSPILLSFERNNITKVNGDFILRFQGYNEENLVVIGEQFGMELCDTTDLYVLEGIGSVFVKPEVNNVVFYDDPQLNWNRKGLITLTPRNFLSTYDPEIAIASFNSSFNRSGYYYTPNYFIDNRNTTPSYAVSILPYREYFRSIPFQNNGEIIKQFITQPWPPSIFKTPYGENMYGLMQGVNSTSQAFEITQLSYSDGLRSTIVLSAFIKLEHINYNETASIEFEIYNQNGVLNSNNLMQRIHKLDFKYISNGEWCIVTMSISNPMPISIMSSIWVKVKLIGGIPNSTAILYVAGLGAYCVPESDKDNFNNNGVDNYRHFIRPYVPF